MRIARPVAAALLTVALAPASAGAAQLRAGAAAVDITPANGASTLGFVRPDITVHGVHTRLTGRVLVLDDGDTEVALLSTDLAFPHDKESLVARVRNLGFSHETILYTGTHTHSGPEGLDAWQVEQLAKAIRLAHERRVPARAGWAQVTVPGVGRNRSIEAHLANHGIEQFYGEGRHEDDPDGIEHTRDTRLRVLRVQREGGGPLAAWMNFPVHLTTSTPAVDVWDSDLAGPAEHHLEDAVGGTNRLGPGGLPEQGFVAMYTNGALGDLMPVFDSYNPTAVMDRHGRRIAAGAHRAWRLAARRLKRELPLDVRWTRICYCGQEVETGRRVASTPVFGLPFLGGSEDGASIFHEPLATEGRRLPGALADPVHGRKIQAIPSEPLGVHEVNPEVQLVRVGNRLLVGAPGEPSVEMGRRFEAAVRPHLPAGVTDPVIVGLSNDYLGYLTTPEEYEMQHYEGGHTVYGTWTSLLMRGSFVALAQALQAGKPAPAPSQPGGLGDAAPAAPAVGDGGVAGALTLQPPESAKRMSVIEIGWTGAPGGVDRPADRPLLTLERWVSGAWQRADSDLGLAFLWRESDGTYGARYDLAPGLAVGMHRLRVTSARYNLETRPFTVTRSDELVPLGVQARRLKGRRTRLVVRAQNPPPDPRRAILFRDVRPSGGRAVLQIGQRRIRARWRAFADGWVADVRGRIAAGTGVAIAAGSLRDGAGNVNGADALLKVGAMAAPKWPTNMGVGGGRTPGPFGQGQFPPGR